MLLLYNSFVQYTVFHQIAQSNMLTSFTLIVVLNLSAVYLVSSVRHILLEAVHTANVDQVKYLLGLDQEILTSTPPVYVDKLDDTHGRTPLLVCGLQPMDRDRADLGKDCVKIAKMLHKAGANMKHVDNAGWDAVSMGAVRGMTSFCQYMLKSHDLDIDRKDADGRNALMKAAAHGYFDTFEMLFRRGATLKSVTDNMGMTALHYATTFALQNPTQMEFFKNLTLFVSNSAQKERTQSRKQQHALPVSIDSFVDHNGRTCLMYAAISNNIEVSTLLLAVGADPRKTDKYGVSCASMSRDEALQRLLADASIALVEKEHEAWLKQSSRAEDETGDNSDQEF